MLKLVLCHFVGLLSFVYGEQVSLVFTRDNQRLDIRCSFRGTRNGNISHVSSLVLSRMYGGNEEILATASLFPEHADNLLGATKTGSFSEDQGTESFINLQWRTATKSLDGLYKCEMDGFDPQNTHVEIKQSKTLTLTDTDPSLTINPDIIEGGLTREMALNCSVDNPADIGMMKVVSIDLKATRNGLGLALSSVSVFHGIVTSPGSEEANVTGQLGGDDNYLAMTWLHPMANLTGRYICEVTGMDINKDPINFVRYIDVSVDTPTTDELVTYIHTLEEVHDIAVNSLTQQLKEEARKHKNCYLESGFSRVYNSCEELPFDMGRYKTRIAINESTAVDVICEVEAPGIVWTIFQRRFDGSLNFNRSFSDYENGFGTVDGEYWLGLRNIKALLGNTNLMRFNLKGEAMVKEANFTYHEEVDYTTFSISNGPKYTLTVDGKNHSRDFKCNNNQSFSTYDYGPKTRCGMSDGAGWWFYNCTYANPNGIYNATGEKGIRYKGLYKIKAHLLRTVIKFRSV